MNNRIILILMKNKHFCYFNVACYNRPKPGGSTYSDVAEVEQLVDARNLLQVLHSLRSLVALLRELQGQRSLI